METTEINGRIEALVLQRTTALNDAVALAGKYALALEQIEKLKVKIKELEDD